MRKSKRGFTIVELVIVIAVIAILASVLIPTFSGIIAKADESSAKQRATNLLKEYCINNPNAKSFTDNGTEYYVAYFTVVRGGSTYIFRYGMDGNLEQIDESELPTFSGFLSVDVYETDYDIAKGENTCTKLYQKKLSTGEYLYYQVSPADDDGNFSITAVFDSDTSYWALFDEYYILTPLSEIVFYEETDTENDGAATVKDAAGIVYQSNGSGQASVVGYEGTDTAVVIPDTAPNGEPVTCIERFAFRYKPIVSVTIGKNVTKINSHAFGSCSNLQKVTLNDGIQVLNSSSFYNCEKLSSINLPSSLKKIYGSSFKDCQSLANITLPDGCTICGGAFCNTTDICFANGTDTMTDGEYTYSLIDGALVRELITDSVGKELLWLKRDCTIPKNQNITGIADLCFAHDDIVSVYIPDSVTDIGAAAFYQNDKLEEVTGCNCVKKIGVQAFRYCKNLKSITLSDTVEFVGAAAFGSCANLTITLCGNRPLESGALSAVKSIVLEKVNAYQMINGCMVDNSGVVCQCEYNATIPTDVNVTALGKNCFDQCAIGGDIVIPNNITTLQSFCFRKCRNITSLSVGKNVDTMGSHCFYYATRLGSAVLECEITALPEWTFGYCTSLTEVTLPATIREIGGNAFNGCTKLDTIRYGGTVTDWQSITFGTNWNSEMPTFSVICSDGTLIYKP